jgi:type II secretory pathway component PulC
VLRVVVKLVLIFVLLYAGVRIWYGRLEEKLLIMPETGGVAVVQKEEEKTEILRKPDDYTIIVDRNIFQAGITEAVEDIVEEAPEELEPTKLKLSLMGTVSGNEPDARAIIADDLKKQQDIYHVGDTVQGALIKGIDRGRVILHVNGVDEVLSLADREGGGPAYEPPASEYYQEPVEPQVEPEIFEQPEVIQEAAEPVEAPETFEQPEAVDVPEPTEQITPEIPTRGSPPVRPRPYRRPARVSPGSPGTSDY